MTAEAIREKIEKFEKSLGSGFISIEKVGLENVRDGIIKRKNDLAANRTIKLYGADKTLNNKDEIERVIRESSEELIDEFRKGLLYKISTKEFTISPSYARSLVGKIKPEHLKHYLIKYKGSWLYFLGLFARKITVESSPKPEPKVTEPVKPKLESKPEPKPKSEPKSKPKSKPDKITPDGMPFYEDYIDFEKHIFLRDRNYFKIGTVELLVPPQVVRVVRSSEVDKIPLIRGAGDMIKNAGKELIFVSMEIYFPRGTFENELRRLVIHARHTPFVPVISTYLNDVYDIDALAINSLDITTVENFPYLNRVILTATKFNWRAYLQGVYNITQTLTIASKGDKEETIRIPDVTITFADTIEWESYNWYIRRLCESYDEILNRESLFYKSSEKGMKGEEDIPITIRNIEDNMLFAIPDEDALLKREEEMRRRYREAIDSIRKQQKKVI